MILSKRERYIVVGSAALLGALALFYLVIDPLMDARADVIQKTEEREGDLRSARHVIDLREHNEGVWKRVSPLLAGGRPGAESMVRTSVNTWSTEARMNLLALKSDGRDEKELLPSQKSDKDPNTESFHKLGFHYTGTGTMQEITAFLFKLRNANFPLRIIDLTISTKKEGTDDLTLTIGFTSIYYPPQAERPSGAVALLAREDR